MPHQVVSATSPPEATPDGQTGQPALTSRQLADWDEFEQRFFRDHLERQRQEDDLAKLDFETRKAHLTVELSQCRREKASFEKKLKAVDDRLAMLQDGLRSLVDDYKVHCLNVRVSRNRAHYDLQERFKKSREGGPLDTAAVAQLRLVGPAMMGLPIRDGRHSKNGTAESGKAAPSAAAANEDTADAAGKEGVGEPDATGVTVCRSDGTAIGVVRKLDEEPRVAKDSVNILLDLPVKRPVVIREGRRFGPSELDSIYQSNDGRFSKWFSCMIHAVGTERPTPCDLCARNSGPFALCVRVDGASPRCSNCEWSRRACQDPRELSSQSLGAGTVSDSEPNSSLTASRRRLQRQAPDTSTNDSFASDSVPVVKLTGPSGSHRAIAPAPSRARSSGSRDVSADAEQKQRHDTSATGMSESSDMDPEQLLSPTLTLRHDGREYTHPELMAGVPVEKIDQDHPYWEPSWKDPVDLIRATLAVHEEMYNACVQDAAIKPAHNKYFRGRQVNRGRSSLDFLEKGSFHPFQLVAKKWMVPGITTYDTLHRLAGTLEELEKFKIKVSPADWLRQRLCDIMESQGDKFSLISTVKDLYHDPKVQALRHMRGFGSVGRPMKGNTKGTGPSNSRKRKRKAKDGKIAGVASPRSKRIMADESVTASPVVPSSAVTPEPADDDLEYDGCTDTDSVCDVGVGDGDFRIRKIRTTRHTTSQDITQYWHLVPNIGLDLLLLRSVDPPQWTQRPPADDFAAAMDDISEVAYHPESLKVRVVLRSGGEIMAWLCRERTKRRLLALCREEGREIRRAESREHLEWEWMKLGSTSRELSLADFGEP